MTDERMGNDMVVWRALVSNHGDQTIPKPSTHYLTTQDGFTNINKFYKGLLCFKCMVMMFTQ